MIFEQANEYVAENIGVDPREFVEAVQEGWNRDIFKNADLLNKFSDEQCEEALLQAALSGVDACLDAVSDAVQEPLVTAACEALRESLTELADPFDLDVIAFKAGAMMVGAGARQFSRFFLENRHVEGAQRTCIMNMTHESILVKTHGQKSRRRCMAHWRLTIAHGQTECIEAPPGQEFWVTIWVGSEREPRHHFVAQAEKQMYYCVTPEECRNVALQLSLPAAPNPELFSVVANDSEVFVDGVLGIGDAKDQTIGFHQKNVYMVGHQFEDGSIGAARLMEEFRAKHAKKAADA